MSRLGARAALAALALFAACGEPEEPAPPRTEYRGGSPSNPGGGGGGLVTAPGETTGQGVLEDRFRAAREMVKRRDYDRAQAEFAEVALRAKGTPLGEEAAVELKKTEDKIWLLPATTIDEALRGLPSQLDRRVLVRGLYGSGGPIGVNAHYFWVRQDEQRMQCRYHKLPQAEKKRFRAIRDGAAVAARGILRPAWSGDQDPFLEVTVLRTE